MDELLKRVIVSYVWDWGAFIWGCSHKSNCVCSDVCNNCDYTCRPYTWGKTRRAIHKWLFLPQWLCLSIKHGECMPLWMCTCWWLAKVHVYDYMYVRINSPPKKKKKKKKKKTFWSPWGIHDWESCKVLKNTSRCWLNAIEYAFVPVCFHSS